MRSVCVVPLVVVLGHDFGFLQRTKLLDGDEFVAEFVVEVFRECVLPLCS